MESGEKKLGLSSEPFFQLIEQLKEGVVLTSPSLQKPNPQIIYVNRRLQEITGYSAEELIGQSPRIFQGERTNYEMLHALKESLLMEQSFTMETINYRKDGRPYEVELTVSPIKNEDGSLLYFLGIQRDISARRETERAYLETEKLHLALEAEKELNCMKANFITHFTENMRQPLTVIRVAAELLQRHGKQIATERIDSRLRLIMNEVDYLASTLDEIQMAGKGFDIKPVLQIQNIELALLIKDIVAHLDKIYPERKFIFESKFLSSQQLKSDGRLIRTIFQHLLSNAAKFSEPKSQIYISLRSLGNKLEIVITDNGIGIPKESQSQLFKQYFRAPNASSYKGIGLGLVIVRKNLEVLGGSIEISSKEKVGTSVRVLLPKDLE